MKDALGDRMKSQYEDRTRYMLPRRTYTIIRIDGKAFHTFTRGMIKPFDSLLHEHLCSAAKRLCEEAQGCKLAYVQSDEASFLLRDFDDISTQAWFDGNVQKICSVAASVFTEGFGASGAYFDARVFTIPDAVEVENYFIWRQKDAERNSLQSVAQSLYSHKELHLKSQVELNALIQAKGANWNDFPDWAKQGSAVYREEYAGPEESRRTRWVINAARIFTQDREWLQGRVHAEVTGI